jgi:penicillin-binding protein 1B
LGLDTTALVLGFALTCALAVLSLLADVDFGFDAFTLGFFAFVIDAFVIDAFVIDAFVIDAFVFVALTFAISQRSLYQQFVPTRELPRWTNATPLPNVNTMLGRRLGLQKLSLRQRRWLTGFFLSALGALLLAALILGSWLLRLDREISERLAQKRFAPPVEFYSAPEFIRSGQYRQREDLLKIFARRNYRTRQFGQPLHPGDISAWSGHECQSILGAGTQFDEVTNCLAYRLFLRPNSGLRSTDLETEAATPETESLQIIAFDSNSRVVGTFSGANPRPSEAALLDPELFAQYYGDKPTLRDEVDLGKIPLACVNSVIAIEDPKFLEHVGVSFVGLARAVYVNLRDRRAAQGGSTITQQLVKNYFLTPEKSIQRKLTEIAMAFLVERRATKEEILETYFNLIYMGQNGPFEVRGYAAASRYYFNKSIENLELPECALLAAVLNSPGHFNPFTKTERAKLRRERVANKMREAGMIDEATVRQIVEAPMPTATARTLSEPAPYFVRAARKELAQLGFDPTQGLRVFTTLDLRAQEAAQQAVRRGLDQLETQNKHVKGLKEKGRNLEAALIATDPRSGFITAMVGGRGFVATQFNRATESRRQVGSVMKPLVYLAAFEADPEKHSPLEMLDDSAHEFKYDGQRWTPRNYDGQYRGLVPSWLALSESLNAPVARLGFDLGLKKVIDVARRAGIASRLEAVPSLTLGAFELPPIEVAQAFTTLARMGSRVPLSTIYRIETLSGRELHAFRPTGEEALDPEATAQVVGMLEVAVNYGTAKLLRALGMKGPMAGKTGTTNDKKDAWFAGMTPSSVAVVWVGYDDNTPHLLTGGGGATPIWADFIRRMENPVLEPEALSLHDFDWPPGVERRSLELETPIPNYPERVDLKLRSDKSEATPSPVDPEDQEPI